MRQRNFVKIFNSTQTFKIVSCLTIWINIKNRLNYMCLRRAPEKYTAGAMASMGAALDRAAVRDYINRAQLL
jgi:hypothetical protein